MRIAIYARFSSDNQSEASIDDQVRKCQEWCAKSGQPAKQTYADRAMSGTTAFRPKYQELLNNIRQGYYDAILAESLDRFSRDQEGIAQLYNIAQFCNVKIITLSEGVINEMHIGLKGTMNALYIKDLAQKTRRGMEGRVLKGCSGGGKAYGYSPVHGLKEDGPPITGELVINDDEAHIVRRIFELYAAGLTPIAIAKTLNEQGVPGPQGKRWRDTTIRGHKTRQTGILRNQLYIGVIVWNRQSFVKNPETGKRVSRPNPPSEWIVTETPHTRIIDQAVWDKVQQRLDGIYKEMKRNEHGVALNRAHRKRHLLSGLLKCAHCGSDYIIMGKARYGCSNYKRGQATCTNSQTIRQEVLEQRVLAALRDKLLTPENTALFVKSYKKAAKEARVTASQLNGNLERQIDSVQKAIDGLIAVVEAGSATPSLLERLKDREAEKEALVARKADLPDTPKVIDHPNIPELFARQVENLHQSLSSSTIRTQAAETLSKLIEKIVVTPDESSPDNVHLEVHGALAQMLAFAGGEDLNKKLPGSDEPGSQLSVVAGARFELTTFRL